MDSEKKVLDSGVEPPKRNLNQMLVITVAVVTTALVILSILGGLYFHKIQSDCASTKENGSANQPERKYNQHYKTTNDDGEQDVDVDTKNEVEKFVQKDENGHITGVVLFDYSKRVMAMYVPEVEECYIHGGIDQELGSFNDSVKALALNPSAKDKAEWPKTNYQVVDENPITDRSVLPEELESYCESSTLYWMDRNTTEVQRQKRGCYWRYYCYWVCCWRVVCGVRLYCTWG